MNKDEILAQMKNKSVTNGWDVVCAMSADKITSLFEDKYKNDEKLPCPESGIWDSGLPCKINPSYETLSNKVDTELYLGPPQISFIPNDSTKCKCKFLIRSGTFKSYSKIAPQGTVSVSKNNLKQIIGTGTFFELQVLPGDYIQIGSEVVVVESLDKDNKNIINVETPFTQEYTNYQYSIFNAYQVIPSDPSDKHEYYITSIVPLAMIEGSVANGHDVVIDFNSDNGNYNTDIELDPAFSTGLSDALKNYFKTNLEKGKYSLGTLIYTENPELINLTPTNFSFATGVKSGDTTDKGCFMLFIQLKDGMPGSSTYLTGVNGQISNPIPDGYSAALIISSRVFFNQVLLPQYKAQFNSNVSVNNPSVMTDCTIKCTGSIDVGRLDSIQNQDVMVPSDNFKIYCEDNALKVDWSESWNQTVQYKRSVYVGGEAYEIIDDGEININISTNNQNYTFSVTEPDEVLNCSSKATVNADIEKQSFWDGYGITRVKNELNSLLNRKLNNILNIQLKGVSIFAVSNLLFPQNHIITYQSDGVYAPGDLIIFGNTKSKL